MAAVQLSDVTKTYPGPIRAVDHVNLTIHDRELVVLVGPSGCGKTTTLRLIAGLEHLTVGTIRIGDRVVNDVSPKDRDVAMVFQSCALYPHMKVYRNLTFGLLLRRRHARWNNPVGYVLSRSRWEQARAERRDIDRRVRQVAETLGIADLLGRRPQSLSGGERQRVAVGRAIVRQPHVFLFDEPLSNLDARLRVTMRAELKQLQRQLQTTTIYVTHDQEEALTLGDRVAVMKDGVIHQCGTPTEVYQRPADRFVAGFIGHPPMNFLEGRLVREGDRLLFDEGSHRLPVAPEHVPRLGALIGQPVVLGLRPEALSFSTDTSVAAALDVQVDVVEPLGDRAVIYSRTPRGTRLAGRVDMRHQPGERSATRLAVDLLQAHYFEPGAAGRNILHA